MLNMPELVKCENGNYVYKYKGSLSEEYKKAEEFSARGVAKVTTLKGKDFVIDKYGNHVRSLSEWYDTFEDKPEEFLYLQTELFANKELVLTFIKMIKNELQNRFRGKSVEELNSALESFDVIVEEKKRREAENLKDYIATLTDWQCELENGQEDDLV